MNNYLSSLMVLILFVLVNLTAGQRVVADGLPIPGDAAIPPDFTVQRFDPGVGPLGAEGAESIPPQSTVGSNFQAQPDGLTSIPPDTHGAIGPNHAVSITNTHVKIQNRSGTQLEYVPLNTWWGSTLVFDPRVIYDPFTDRFYAVAARASRSGSSSILVRVSKTGNPVGATDTNSTWWTHVFDVDASNLMWADFPTIGFNKNWIAVQSNFYNVSNDAFNRQQVFTFTKSSVLTGTFQSTMAWESTAFAGLLPAITMDNTDEHLYFVGTYNSTEGALTVRRLEVLSGNLFMRPISFPAAEPFGLRPVLAEFCPQSGSSIKVANNDARVQNVVTRNGAVWCTQTVFYPATGAPTRSSVQWMQLTKTNAPPVQVGLIDDPSGAEFFAYPSIAVNRLNDVVINVCSFNANKFASAAYAFHAGTDPPGVMQTLMDTKAGEGLYFKRSPSGVNRWGDYSAVCVDPVNDKDFWAIQTYAATPVSPATTNGNGRWGAWWIQIIADRRPVLSNLHINANNFFECSVTGIAGRTYRIDGSDTLGGWTQLESGVSPFTFVDEDRANFPLRRFYHASEVEGGGGGMAPLMAGGGDLRGASLMDYFGSVEAFENPLIVHPAQPAKSLPAWQLPPQEPSESTRRLSLQQEIETVERWIREDNAPLGEENLLYLEMRREAQNGLNALEAMPSASSE